jgi:hypothetical protein
MKRFLAFLLLLVPAGVFGQYGPTVKLSDRDGNGDLIYTEKFVTVPPPVGSMTAYSSVYSYPMPPNLSAGTFFPGGQFELRNALVDKRQRVGAWSNPAVVDVTKGWQIQVLDHNQPTSADCIGVVWKIRFITINSDPGPFTTNVDYLFITNFNAGIGPLQYRGSNGFSVSWPRWMGMNLCNTGFSLSNMTYGGSNTTVAPAPYYRVCNVPQEAGTVQYCWVTHTGETALSTSTAIVPQYPGSGGVGVVENIYRANEFYVMGIKLHTAYPAPMGALGFHVYYNGKRVPAPHCIGIASTPDDWLWPLDQYKITLFNIDPNGPTHSAAAPAQSKLNALQVAMKETRGSVVNDLGVDLPLYCPMIDEWAMYGTSDFKFRRKIHNGGNGPWRVVQTKNVPGAPGGHAMYWPGLLVYNQYSTWEGASIEMPYGSCAVAFSDYSGGQGFGNKFTECVFSADAKSPQTDQPRSPLWLSQGVRVIDECAAAGHTASELFFRDCSYSAMVPISFEGNQTANVKFSRMHVYSPADDRRACAVWIASPNQYEFNDGAFMECVNNVIFNIAGPSPVFVRGIWVDGGCKSLVDFTNYQTGSLSIDTGKINFFVPNANTRPTLSRIVATSSVTKVSLTRLALQFNYVGQFDLCCPAYNRMDFRVQDSELAASTAVIREPTRDQWLAKVSMYAVPDSWGLPDAPPYQQAAWAEWQSFINPPVPGYRITIPANTASSTTASVTVAPFNVTIPAGTGTAAAYTYTINQRINNASRTTPITITIPERPVTIPARTIVIPAQSVQTSVTNIVVPAQDVVVNSFSGRQKTLRVDWASPLTYVTD